MRDLSDAALPKGKPDPHFAARMASSLFGVPPTVRQPAQGPMLSALAECPVLTSEKAVENSSQRRREALNHAVSGAGLRGCGAATA